jgi:hypothetical protein
MRAKSNEKSSNKELGQNVNEDVALSHVDRGDDAIAIQKSYCKNDRIKNFNGNVLPLENFSEPHQLFYSS